MEQKTLFPAQFVPHNVIRVHLPDSLKHTRSASVSSISFSMAEHPICKDFLSARVKLRIKEKSGATNTGQFSEKSEGAKLSNSLMVLGYENGLILSICFYLGSFPTRSCFRKGESDDESFDIHH